MANAPCTICGTETDIEKERGSSRNYYCGLEHLNEGRRREPSLAGFYEKQDRMQKQGGAFRQRRKSLA